MIKATTSTTAITVTVTTTSTATTITVTRPTTNATAAVITVVTTTFFHLASRLPLEQNLCSHFLLDPTHATYILLRTALIHEAAFICDSQRPSRVLIEFLRHGREFTPVYS